MTRPITKVYVRLPNEIVKEKQELQTFYKQIDQNRKFTKYNYHWYIKVFGTCSCYHYNYNQDTNFICSTVHMIKIFARSCSWFITISFQTSTRDIRIYS